MQAWLGSAWHGLAWPGTAWQGMRARRGQAWLGWARQGKAGVARPGKAGHGKARLGRSGLLTLGGSMVSMARIERRCAAGQALIDSDMYTVDLHPKPIEGRKPRVDDRYDFRAHGHRRDSIRRRVGGDNFSYGG